MNYWTTPSSSIVRFVPPLYVLPSSSTTDPQLYREFSDLRLACSPGFHFQSARVPVSINRFDASKDASKDGSKRSPVAAQDEQLSTKEMERRIKLLQEDSELQKLHKQFVLGGVLTEAEFWATRKKLLDGDTSKVIKQRARFKSAMLADVKPSADGRSNRVTFNLTPEIIHQIKDFKIVETEENIGYYAGFVGLFSTHSLVLV